MPLRKMTQKKFRGIYEYYKASDHDKTTTAYYINVRGADGKSRKIKTNARTPEEAAVALAGYKATRTAAPVISNNKMTLDGLAVEFFKNRKTSNNPKDKRKYDLHISPSLGGALISKISKRDIVNLQMYLQEKEVPVSSKENAAKTTLTPKSINNITDLASRILNWGTENEFISDTIKKITKLKVSNERQRVFSDAEIDLIFLSTEGDTLMFLMLMYYSAQRPQSILSLRKRDVINGQLYVKSIKGQDAHLVPIAPKLEDALMPWIDNLQPDDFIVSKDSRPMPYQTMSGRISKLFKRLFNQGMSYKEDSQMWASIYTLRHTALTNIYANTADIYAAQSIANHSSVQMTQRYAKRSDSLKRNALEGL